jgi:methoxymalonate biosynthesis acyl carrier protein
MKERERDQVIRYIADRVKGVEVDHDEDLFASGHVNSLFAVQLVMWIQRTFGVQIERGELDFENFKSIDAIIGFVDGKRSGAGVPAAAGTTGAAWTSR